MPVTHHILFIEVVHLLREMASLHTPPPPVKKMSYIDVGSCYLAVCCEALCAEDEFVGLPSVVKVAFFIPVHQ